MALSPMKQVDLDTSSTGITNLNGRIYDNVVVLAMRGVTFTTDTYVSKAGTVNAAYRPTEIVNAVARIKDSSNNYYPALVSLDSTGALTLTTFTPGSSSTGNPTGTVYGEIVFIK